MSRKLTIDEVKEQFVDNQPIGRYLYEYFTEYVDTKTPIPIYCNLHKVLFHQAPVEHKKGKTGCEACGILKTAQKRTKTTDQFETESNKIHNGRYGYKFAIYTKGSNYLTITCPVHGNFIQKPIEHLRGYGCRECGYDIARENNQKRVMTLEDFKKECTIIHNGEYDYSHLVQFKNSSEKIPLTCKRGHRFKISVTSHYHQKAGCKKCGYIDTGLSSRLSTEEFKEKAKIVHPNLYDYSLVHYVDAYTPVLIRCLKHNYTFPQKPSAHLSGNGCSICGQLNKYGMSRSKFIEVSERLGKVAKLYVLEFSKDDELFYKIGITNNSVKYRYAGKKKADYNVNVLLYVQSLNSSLIWDLEKLLHREHAANHYSPITHFHGSMLECFSSIDGILDHIPFDQVEVITDLLSQQEIVA